MAEAIVGDNVPAEVEVSEEGAAPDSLSYAELEARLNGTQEATIAEPQAEEVEPAPVVEPTEAVKPVTVTQEEFDKLKKKMENQELFIQRQGTEVGNLRKLKENLIALAKEKRALAQEQLTMDPSAALDTHAEARDAEKQASEAGEREAIEANKQVIHETFPDYTERIEDIARAALEMGVPAQFVESYRQNPYATPVGVLLPYARAAALTRQYMDKAALVDKLTGQLVELNKNSGNLASRIKETARKAPVVTGKGGAQTLPGMDTVDESQITSLTDAEIERLLNPK